MEMSTHLFFAHGRVSLVQSAFDRGLFFDSLDGAPLGVPSWREDSNARGFTVFPHVQYLLASSPRTNGQGPASGASRSRWLPALRPVSATRWAGTKKHMPPVIAKPRVVEQEATGLGSALLARSAAHSSGRRKPQLESERRKDCARCACRYPERTCRSRIEAS